LVLPPNTREWVKARLNEKRLSRDDKEEIAETLLIALDRDGTRYVNPDTKDYYYFENATKVLHPFRFDQVSQLRTSSFGALLASKYGIKTADTEVVSRLADGFIAFPPIESTAPRRAVHASDDAVYYQISDGEIAKVTRHGLEIVPNGTDSVLFLPDQVVPLNSRSLVEAYDKASKYALNPRWLETLETVNLVALEPLTLDETRVLLTCLFYMSPWLAHWRELQAPMEIAVAEGGSGKTMLYNLRMGILTGDQSLAGLPDDFRSWTAAVTAAPGMWVCDNLAAVRTDYWHQLNGAIANLVTDTDPRISTRTLYTTASLSKIPVRATFAVTTIKNPFTAPDILGRSIVYQLQAVPVGQRDANWVSRRLKEREAWVVEELIVLSRFLALAHRRWDEEYQSGHRLKHFEQAILLLGEVLGLSVEDIVPRLPEVTSTSVAEYDPIIEALKAFTEEWESPNARLADVVEWVQADVDSRFSAIKTLGNVILLGRYIKSHQADIKGATGIEVVVRHNATLLRLTTLAGDDDEA
jgi:hypothetical protein